VASWPEIRGGGRSQTTNLKPMDRTENIAAPLTCDRCGAHEAHEVAGQKLCENCYVGAGSCCPGWGEDEEPPGPRDCPRG
jgi:hypothetical protein